MSSYKIVVLGSGSVGKSALTVRLVSNHFLAVYDPTVEESYRTQTTIDNEPAVLEIIDTAGQEEYNAIKEAHVVKSQGFLLVFSLTSRQSFDDLEAIHETIYHLKEKDPAKDDIPMVIAGNKCDLEADRCVAITEGEDLAKSWRCIFHPTSALSKVGVEEAFYDIVRKIRLERGTKASGGSSEGGSRRKICTLL